MMRLFCGLALATLFFACSTPGRRPPPPAPAPKLVIRHVENPDHHACAIICDMDTCMLGQNNHLAIVNCAVSEAEVCLCAAEVPK
jgi:hypothetical protein